MESPRRWSNEMKKQPHTVIFLSFLGMSSRQVLISAGAFSKQLEDKTLKRHLTYIHNNVSMSQLFLFFFFSFWRGVELSSMVNSETKLSFG